MQDFIKSVSAKLGVDESIARTTTANAMSWLKDNLGGDAFSSVAAKVDGAQTMADTGTSDIPDEGTSGGGLMGSLGGMASGLMGGQGEGGGLMGLLGKSGLSMDKIPEFGTMLLNFLKEKCGPQIIEQITSKVPMLKSFVS